MLARLSGEDDNPRLEIESPPSAESLARFRPVIESSPPLLVQAQRFVTSAKFGRGRVLRDLGAMLEIDFGDAGIRRLYADFAKRET